MRQRKLPDRNPNHPGWQGLFIGFIWVSALFPKAFVPLLVYLNNWNFPASHPARLQQHPLHPTFVLEGTQKGVGKFCNAGVLGNAP